MASPTYYTALSSLCLGGDLPDSIETRSGPGAVDPDRLITQVVSTGVGDALTMVNGSRNGQIKIMNHKTDGGTAVLTPTQLAGASTTITFNAVGDCVILMWQDTDWYILSNLGCTVA